LAMMLKRIERLQAELAHLDAVLRMFRPDFKAEGLPVRHRCPTKSPCFRHGELTQRIFDALRERREIAGADVATAAMRDKTRVITGEGRDDLGSTGSVQALKDGSTGPISCRLYVRCGRETEGSLAKNKIRQIKPNLLSRIKCQCPGKPNFTANFRP